MRLLKNATTAKGEMMTRALAEILLLPLSTSIILRIQAILNSLAAILAVVPFAR
jgi:hypothetical protein